MLNMVGLVGRIAGVGRAVASSISYLLQATFTADNQSITDGQVLDTAAEGVETGSVTVADGAVGAWSIAGNALQCVKSSIATPNATFISDDYLSSYARGNCLIVGYKNVSGGSWSIGWLDSTSPPTTSYQDFAIMQWGSNDMYIESFDAGAVLFYPSTAIDGTEEQAAIVVGGYNSSYVPWDGASAGYSDGAAFFFNQGGGWKLGYRYRESVFAAPATAWTVGGVIENGITQTFTKMLVPDVDLSSLLAPVVLDTFTDTNGTDLSSHTSDVGATWTQTVASSFDVQSNKARRPGTAAVIAFATQDLGSADVVQECVLNRASTASYFGLATRVSDASNGWWVDLVNGTQFRLIEYNATVQTQRASAAVTDPVAADFRFVVISDGSTISAYMDDANRISYASATFNQTETAHGLYGYGYGADNTYENYAAYSRTGYTDLDNY